MLPKFGLLYTEHKPQLVSTEDCEWLTFNAIISGTMQAKNFTTEVSNTWEAGENAEGCEWPSVVIHTTYRGYTDTQAQEMLKMQEALAKSQELEEKLATRQEIWQVTYKHHIYKRFINKNFKYITVEFVY